jgi:hypothetical protein
LTDNNSGLFIDRAINIVGSAELYSFTSFTFTNAGVTGSYGPRLSDFLSAYSPAWTDNNAYFNASTDNTDRGVQIWTAPKSGTYIIKAAGARGGNSYNISAGTFVGAGLGAYSQGNFSITRGTKFAILVGHAGEDVQSGVGPNGSYHGGGGGGASWVLSEDRTYLYAVGGGGGGKNATRWAGNTQYTISNGGTSQGNTTINGSLNTSSTNHGGGSGFVAESGRDGQVRNGYHIGGAGSTAAGGTGGQQMDGGFGGGGGAQTGGGGGGGYAGGGTTAYGSAGGLGGSSRNNGSSPSFATHTGQHGFVYIEFVS